MNIALRAYANAWSYYKWLYFGTAAHWLIHGLFALDGLRVCYEELDDAKNAWWDSRGLSSWLEGDYHRYKIGEMEPECDEIIREVEKRFQRAAGRLEPLMLGRAKEERKLEGELRTFWEFTPKRVREDIITAEYKRHVLKDATYSLWDVAHNYCLAVERVISYRLGKVVDAFAANNPSNVEVVKFQKHHLKSGSYRAGGSDHAPMEEGVARRRREATSGRGWPRFCLHLHPTGGANPQVDPI